MPALGVSGGGGHLVECLAIVDTDHGADHLGHDQHVPQVGAHGLRLLPCMPAPTLH